MLGEITGSLTVTVAAAMNFVPLASKNLAVLDIVRCSGAFRSHNLPCGIAIGFDGQGNSNGSQP